MNGHLRASYPSCPRTLAQASGMLEIGGADEGNMGGSAPDPCNKADSAGTPSSRHECKLMWVSGAAQLSWSSCRRRHLQSARNVSSGQLSSTVTNEVQL